MPFYPFLLLKKLSTKRNKEANSLNCGGLSSKLKQLKMAELISRNPKTIFFISETHWTANTKIEHCLKKHLVDFALAPENDKWSGMAKCKGLANECRIIDKDSRFIRARIEDITILSVYGPHKDKSTFWKSLPLQQVHLIIGDFNYIDSPLHSSNPSPKIHDFTLLSPLVDFGIKFGRMFPKIWYRWFFYYEILDYKNHPLLFNIKFIYVKLTSFDWGWKRYLKSTLN